MDVVDFGILFRGPVKHAERQEDAKRNVATLRHGDKFHALMSANDRMWTDD
jgi:hypothetical protein